MWGCPWDVSSDNFERFHIVPFQPQWAVVTPRPASSSQRARRRWKRCARRRCTATTDSRAEEAPCGYTTPGRPSSPRRACHLRSRRSPAGTWNVGEVAHMRHAVERFEQKEKEKKRWKIHPQEWLRTINSDQNFLFLPQSLSIFILWRWSWTLLLFLVLIFALVGIDNMQMVLLLWFRYTSQTLLSMHYIVHWFKKRLKKNATAILLWLKLRFEIITSSQAVSLKWCPGLLEPVVSF